MIKLPKNLIYFIQIIGKQFGFAIHTYQDNYHYCPNTYGVKYWKKIEIKEVDKFNKIASEVIKHQRSFLQYDRLYLVYQAIVNVKKLIEKGYSLSEVGVYKGGGTYFIALVTENLCKLKPRIHAFDTFEGHPDNITASLDGEHQPGDFNNTSYAKVKEYLSIFSNVQIHKGRFQDNCSNIANELFCFVHIDVDIFSAIKDSLEFFEKKLVVGGVIVVDDYGFTSCKGAKQAVDEFTAARDNFVKLHIDTGQCILIHVADDKKIN